MREMYAGYLLASLHISEENKPKLFDQLLEIIRIKKEFIGRVNHTEPGSVKLFYKKLHEDLNKQVDDVMDALFKLSTE